MVLSAPKSNWLPQQRGFSDILRQFRTFRDRKRQVKRPLLSLNVERGSKHKQPHDRGAIDKKSQQSRNAADV
jgi:hypothetical protein